jgi:thioredoxin 1
MSDTTEMVELLDFWAVWCGPCKIMEPILNEIEMEYEGKIVLKKCNVDDATYSDLIEKYQIMSVPTYILLVDGEVDNFFIGVTPKEHITKRIDAVLAKSKKEE